MKIYFDDNNIEILVSDSSYRYREVMGDNLIALYFSLTEFVSFPIGSYVLYDNQIFRLYDLPNFTKINERQYDYQLTFHGVQKDLERYKFRNMQDGRLKFTLTAKPQEFIQHIVDNLNSRDPQGGWSVGEYLISSEKTQSFSHNSIRECLDSIAQLFETEWSIEGKRISLCKTEYGKGNPLSLSYGRGNGFISGVSQQAGTETAVDVLFVQGGERNIDSQNYVYIKDGEKFHANTLRLPKGVSAWYHPSDNDDLGTVSTEKISDDDMLFVTDADGFSIERVSKVNNGYEDSLDLVDIYPSHECTCTSVNESDSENHFWEITDENNPIDYSADKIISGQTMTVIFQSGMLTGKEFDISNYDHATKTFEIVPQEIDGIIMPDSSSGYYPKGGENGDKFAVFHMNLPQEYISEAENKLLLNAAHHLYKRSEVEVNFQGTLDGIWSRNNWDDISNRIQLGFYIKFTDNSFAKDGKLLRVVAVKDYINRPHSPELTLSNSSIAAGVSSQIKKIVQNQAYMEKVNSDTMSFAKRNFQTAKETSGMLQKLVSNIENFNFSGSINPVTVQTLQAVFGDTNLQFTFGEPSFDADDRTLVKAWNQINYLPTFRNGILECQQTYIRHETLTSAEGMMIAAGYDVEYPYWRIQYYTKNGLDAEKPYYLYIVAPKSARNHYNHCVTDAVFELSDIPKDNTINNYYLLMGILNSEYEGERSFASMWGKTEILPNQIITSIIKSNDGSCYIDLIKNEIKGNFNFLDALLSGSIFVGGTWDKSTGGFTSNNLIDLDFDNKEVRFWCGGKVTENKYLKGANLVIYADGSFRLHDNVGGDMFVYDGRDKIFLEPPTFPRGLKALGESDFGQINVSKLIINGDKPILTCFGEANIFNKLSVSDITTFSSSINLKDGFFSGSMHLFSVEERYREFSNTLYIYNNSNSEYWIAIPQQGHIDDIIGTNWSVVYFNVICEVMRNKVSMYYGEHSNNRLIDDFTQSNKIHRYMYVRGQGIFYIGSNDYILKFSV